MLHFSKAMQIYSLFLNLQTFLELFSKNPHKYS